MATQEQIAERNRATVDRNKSVRKAWVVMNYGDLGITEPLYFDFLSRFLVVTFAPNVVITAANAYRHLAIVKRPRELWVDVDGGIQADTTNQLRSDYDGNVNKGDPSSYLINNIPPINRPYQLGEEISVERLREPIYFSNNFFDSEYNSSNFNVNTSKYIETYLTQDPSGPASVSAIPAHWESSRVYPLYPAGGSVTRPANLFGTNHAGASIAGKLNRTLSYPTKANQGNPTTASTASYNVSTHYGIGINKYAFEVFLRFFTGNLSTVDSMINGTLTAGDYNNRYLWNINSPYRISTILFHSCFYEDINVDNKQRNPQNECMPLIVTQPNTFPTPKTRQAGSIKFDPEFTQIINS